MSPSKFLNDSEFKAVLDKVNQVICEFSKSADKTQEAVLFLTKISEKCSSRDEFLKLVEQRLDLLSNPNKSKEHIEWFVTRRRSLVTLLQNIKDKVVRDPTYISKFSPSFGKGIQSLDHLLKLDEKAIGHGHIAELTRVKKLVMEIKAEADTKAKALESAHLVKADAFFLYDKLLDVISTMNVLVLEGGNEVTNHQPTAVLADLLLRRHHQALNEHVSKYRSVLDKEYAYRLECAASVLGSYLQTLRAAVSEDGTSIQGDNTTFTAMATASLPASIVYAALCDLKASEWAFLQHLHACNKTQSTAATVNSSSSSSATATATAGVTAAEEESFGKAIRKRKAQVALEGVKPPPAAQKVLDQLQQQAVQGEAGCHAGRVEHFAAQVKATEEALQGAPWETVVDVTAYAGSACM